MRRFQPDLRDKWAAGRSVVLYGAGGAGQNVARHLATHGILAAAFVDARAAPGEIRAGLPVLTLAEWVQSGRAAGADVIVCIHNHLVNVAPIIDSLRASGFARVLPMVDYIDLFPDDPYERYWLAPTDYYDDKSPTRISIRTSQASCE